MLTNSVFTTYPNIIAFKKKLRIANDTLYDLPNPCVFNFNDFEFSYIRCRWWYIQSFRLLMKRKIRETERKKKKIKHKDDMGNWKSTNNEYQPTAIESAARTRRLMDRRGCA